MPKRKNKKVPHAEQLPSGRYHCRVYDSETKKAFISHEIKPPEIVPSGFLLCFVFFNVPVK